MADIVFPRHLLYKQDRSYAVLGYIGEVNRYIDNKGYVNKNDNTIYIYTDGKPRHNDVPIFHLNKRGKPVYRIMIPLDLEKFNVANSYTLDMDEINNTKIDDNEQLYNEAVLADMNAATTVFKPVINDDDDALKKIIKQAILDMGIDITALKHKLPKKYAITNLKSALIGTTKMSISSFNLWCELLELDYEVIVYNKESCNPHKLPHDLRFVSRTGMMQNE